MPDEVKDVPSAEAPWHRKKTVWTDADRERYYREHPEQRPAPVAAAGGGTAGGGRGAPAPPSPLFSAGAIAERLGVSIDHARAALRALGLLDARGRPVRSRERGYTEADCEAVRQALAPGADPAAVAVAHAAQDVPGEHDGEPERVTAEDAAAVEAITGRPLGDDSRRGRKR